MINGYRLKDDNYTVDAGNNISERDWIITVYQDGFPVNSIIINDANLFKYIKRRAFTDLQSAIDTIRIYEKKICQNL